MLRNFLRTLGFHIHDWDDWEVAGDIIYKDNGGICGRIQQRECKLCKKLRMSRVL